MSLASRARLALVLVVPFVGTGCWEQWSDSWWPQMKWQRVVQAYELQGRPGDEDRQIGNWLPPEGTLAIGKVQSTTEMTLAATEALPNPKQATLASLDNGKKQYDIFCAPCHGLTGLADGPISGPPWGKGPFLGILPVAGPIGSQIVKNLSDGHIYTAISQGIRRMPAYRRIPPGDRWDIVNYVRYLNGQPPSSAAQTAQAPAPQQEGATP